MKKLSTAICLAMIGALFLFAAAAQAGIGRVATFPVRHAHKSARAVKNHIARPAMQASKKVLW